MKNSTMKAINFLKRNAAYIILAFCILAVGLSLTFILVDRRNNQLENNVNNEQELPNPDQGGENQGTSGKPEETPNEPVVNNIVFIMPVENCISISEYSEQMVFNSTLNRFSAHLATDFYAEEGTPVVSVYDGVVESVTFDLLKGTTITVNHGDGLKTVYNSLLDGEQVLTGQAVKQGDVLGYVSVSNRQEYKSGAHLHFEVFENGENIDPVKYLTFEEK